MSKRGLIDSIDVPSPCNESWDKMSGGDQKRLCPSCDKDVYNLSAMSRREAQKLVATNSGKICVRYARLPDGRVLTTDRPFVQIRRSTTAVAAGVFAATVSLSAIAYAQGEPVESKTAGRPTVTRSGQSKGEKSQISFIIVDQTGAVIPGALVTLTDPATKKEFTATTNAVGVATFVEIQRGTYDFSTTAPSFQPTEEKIILRQQLEPNVHVTLAVGAAIVVGDFITTWSDIPLFQAIIREDNATVRQAVRNGFSLKERDIQGRTALHVAVEFRNIDLIRFLLDNGADVNAKDKGKLTPIWMLVNSDWEETGVEMLRLLIRKGADVNIQNQKRTLLMYACGDDDLEGVRLLLNAGAKPNIKDEDGETAIEKTDLEEIKQLLISHGARRP